MRQIAVGVFIWMSVMVVACVGLYGAIGGTALLSVTRPDIMTALIAVPLIVAAHAWPSRLVLALAAFLTVPVLETILATDEPIQAWPVAVALLVIDFWSVRFAQQRQQTGLRVQERDAFEQIGRVVGEAPTVEDLADVVHERGQNLVGEGRFRLWLLDDVHHDLRLVATGDQAVLGRGGRKGQWSADLPRFALADPVACAEAARLGKIVAIPNLLATKDSLAISRKMAESDGYQSVLALPMLDRRHLVGVLTFEPQRPGTHVFTSRERSVLQVVANLSAVAIDSLSSQPATTSSKGPAYPPPSQIT